MEKTIRISFNRDFISLAAIKKGVRDFRRACDCAVSRGGKRLGVALYNFDDEKAETLGDEFSNYVLFIETTRRRAKGSANT
ncbi:MAG: HxsD-like protein [Candidatus Omnitrophica bacterium]|nr:HxsD-like protein [Candidatus Omnitrophota bacterium]